MGHGLRCALADERPKDRGPPTAPRGWLPGPQRRLLALVDCWCQLALTSELLPGEPTGLGRQAGATRVAPTRSHPGQGRAGSWSPRAVPGGVSGGATVSLLAQSSPCPS